MVGDNLKDMMAAKNARIQSIFSTWGFESQGEGDFMIDSPIKLFDIII